LLVEGKLRKKDFTLNESASDGLRRLVTIAYLMK